MKVPSCSSAYARRSSSGVFITMGPYHATGSSIGFPDTSRNRMPASPACTVTASPLSNSTSERFCTSPLPPLPWAAIGPTCSVRTAPGSEASRNVPPPSNTRSEEHTSELQSRLHLVCRLLLHKKQRGRQLCDVKRTDAVTLGEVTALPMFVAMAGCCIPARRATNVDPMLALRYEKVYVIGC